MASQPIDAITTTVETANVVSVTVEDDPVILRCNQTLKLDTAIEILNNTDQYKVINKVPDNPKGGDTYLLIPPPGDEGMNKVLFVHNKVSLRFLLPFLHFYRPSFYCELTI